jgi:DNA-binding MarR family transcriptional regulator
MEVRSDIDRELVLLEHIEHDPDVTQASLAAQLGVAVGTVNWLIKRMIDKGYVKIKRAQRRKLKYIITPEGLAFRAQLTVNYIDTSMRLYRRTRQQVRELLLELKKANATSIYLLGDGDIADIVRLTCLEQGISVLEKPDDGPAVDTGDGLPVLEVRGTRVYLSTHTPQEQMSRSEEYTI